MCKMHFANIRLNKSLIGCLGLFWTKTNRVTNFRHRMALLVTKIFSATTCTRVYSEQFSWIQMLNLAADTQSQNKGKLVRPKDPAMAKDALVNKLTQFMQPKSRAVGRIVVHVCHFITNFQLTTVECHRHTNKYIRIQHLFLRKSCKLLKIWTK